MSGIEDDLIVALTRLKTVLQETAPPEVLQRLVHQRHLMELSRQALGLRTRYEHEGSGSDPRKASRIAELGAEVDRLQGGRG